MCAYLTAVFTLSTFGGCWESALFNSATVLMMPRGFLPQQLRAEDSISWCREGCARHLGNKRCCLPRCGKCHSNIDEANFIYKLVSCKFCEAGYYLQVWLLARQLGASWWFLHLLIGILSYNLKTLCICGCVAWGMGLHNGHEGMCEEDICVFMDLNSYTCNTNSGSSLAEAVSNDWNYCGETSFVLYDLLALNANWPVLWCVREWKMSRAQLPGLPEWSSKIFHQLGKGQVALVVGST